MSYSKRYRERTIEYRQAGHSLEAPHQVFKVSKSTIQKWLRHLDAAKAAFETHCGGIRSQGKKDDQLSGAGSAKGSGISGRDQRYTAGKDRLCG